MKPRQIKISLLCDFGDGRGYVLAMAQPDGAGDEYYAEFLGYLTADGWRATLLKPTDWRMILEGTTVDFYAADLEVSDSLSGFRLRLLLDDPACARALVNGGHAAPRLTA